MTIKNLLDTLDFSSYDKIIVHWPNDCGDNDFHSVTFDYSDPCIELFGNINIMTMKETSDHDGGDASLFIHVDKDDGVVVHIYITREDVVNGN